MRVLRPEAHSVWQCVYRCVRMHVCVRDTEAKELLLWWKWRSIGEVLELELVFLGHSWPVQAWWWRLPLLFYPITGSFLNVYCLCVYHLHRGSKNIWPTQGDETAECLITLRRYLDILTLGKVGLWWFRQDYGDCLRFGTWDRKVVRNSLSNHWLFNWESLVAQQKGVHSIIWKKAGSLFIRSSSAFQTYFQQLETFLTQNTTCLSPRNRSGRMLVMWSVPQSNYADTVAATSRHD